MADLLIAEQVRKEFGGLVATDDIDFTSRRGSIVSLIGPNGAGKTTFFNMLTGVYKPTEWTDRLRRGRRQRQAAARDHRARRRPHLPEHPALPAHDGARERARRDAAACAAASSARSSHAARAARGGGRPRAWPGAAPFSGSRPRQRDGAEPALRRPAPARGRARARDRAEAAAPRRADGRDEPAGDGRLHRLRPKLRNRA